MSTSPEAPRLALRGRGRPLTWGEAALAALAVAVVSGVVLVVPYDAREAWGSVASMLLANPAASWFRNLHYWSAQAFLVLTAVHAWDTVRQRQELRLRSGPWIRVVLAVPVVGLVMLSGFLLRGDPDAAQALRIVTAVVEQVPLVGRAASALLFGGGSLQVVYVHHAATLTVLTWLAVVEHGRVLWPLGRALALVLGAVAALSLGLSAGLHDGLDPTMKGPWYFLGLQEALHQASHPMLVVLLGALLLALLGALRWMPARPAAWTRGTLLAVAAGYLVLTGVGWFLRGEDWRWTSPAAPRSEALVPGFVFRSLDIPAEDLKAHPVPAVLGRPEGCLFCHRDMKGLSRSHDPQAVGCASCHRGQPFSLDPAAAHRGMTLVPGELAGADRTCGTASCHPAMPDRVRQSLMNTMAGVVAVDREFFGEAADHGGPPDARHLGSAGADGHLRQLCVSCHVGAPKGKPGPITGSSRGGGCSACHLTWSLEALAALEAPRDRLPRPDHPTLSLVQGVLPCFGCHSRSGRISLNYEGWHEADPPPGPDVPWLRLEDGRVVFRGAPDVHAEKGMLCTDCHTALEVMGDGTRHARKAEAARTRCEDCHPPGDLRTLDPARLEGEDRKIRSLRPGPAPDRPVLADSRGGALLNTFVDPAGVPHLYRKADGKVLPLRPPSPACRDGAHDRVSCAGCHTAWAPTCVSCHTRFDPKGEGIDLLTDRPVRGEWVEQGGDSSAAPPALGMRASGERSAVEPFAPGMIATLGGDPPLFRRLYALVQPHTVSRKGRSCRSCHNDSTALGYGKGRLGYREGRWTFTPDHPASPQDGLPRDAWIGFLGSREGMVSTREDCRPFTVEEQKRILTVGACLECHDEGSPVMREGLGDFQSILGRVSGKCVLPRWEDPR